MGFRLPWELKVKPQWVMDGPTLWFAEQGKAGRRDGIEVADTANL